MEKQFAMKGYTRYFILRCFWADSDIFPFRPDKPDHQLYSIPQSGWRDRRLQKLSSILSRGLLTFGCLLSKTSSILVNSSSSDASWWSRLRWAPGRGSGWCQVRFRDTVNHPRGFGSLKRSTWPSGRGEPWCTFWNSWKMTWKVSKKLLKLQKIWGASLLRQKRFMNIAMNFRVVIRRTRLENFLVKFHRLHQLLTPKWSHYVVNYPLFLHYSPTFLSFL